MSTCQTTGRVSGGEKSLFQIHRGVWELVKIACARGIPQQSPENSQHETLIASVCLELFWKRGITIYPGCFPNITALLMVLWSLTSAWWLFQRNLPAANLCTCIIASVKLICLFASILLTVATSWQRMSNRLFVIVFLVSEVRNIFLPIDKATVIQSRASVENDFPAVWFGAVFIWEGFRAKLLPPILLGNETGEDVQHLGALEGNVHLFLLSAAEKPRTCRHCHSCPSGSKIEGAE